MGKEGAWRSQGSPARTCVASTSRRVTVLHGIAIGALRPRPGRQVLEVCPPPAAPGADLMSWLLHMGVIFKTRVRSSGW